MDPQVSTERILAAADQSRQLFPDSGYQPRSTKISDGEMPVFEREGADKHVTILRLAAATQPARCGSTEKAATVTAPALSYISDAESRHFSAEERVISDRRTDWADAEFRAACHSQRDNCGVLKFI